MLFLTMGCRFEEYINCNKLNVNKCNLKLIYQQIVTSFVN